MRRALPVIIAVVAISFLALKIASDASAQSETLSAQFLEEDPADKYGLSLAGVVRWRLQQSASAKAAQIDGDVEIPARQLAASLSIRPSSDPSSSASHLVEVRFVLPGNFRHGDVSEVPGIIVRETNNVRGNRLIAQVVKQSPNVFLVGLARANVQRNSELLSGGRWFDITMRFANNQRAVLGVQMGDVFKQAFAASAQ